MKKDKDKFTLGTSIFSPVGGIFSDDIISSALSSGSIATCAITAYRALHVTLYDSTGLEITSFGGGSGAVRGTQAVNDVPEGKPVQIGGWDYDNTKVVEWGIDVDGQGYVADWEMITRMGDVTANPTTNTLLYRVKALLTGIVLNTGSNIIGRVGIDQTTPGTTNKVSLGTDTVAVSGPLTDTQLRATAVPVSGTVTASGPLTDTQLRASDVKVTLDSESVAVTGTFWQATQPVSASSLPLPSGAATESTLSTLNGKVTACNTGSVTIGSALPAGTNLLGGIASSAETGTVYQGTTAKTPVTLFANVSASQTDSVLLAAQGSGNKIRVLQVACVCGATATNITFNSKGGGAGTAITCLFANAANGGEVLPFSPIGWFTTSANEALTCTTGAGSTTGLLLKYIVVT